MARATKDTVEPAVPPNVFTVPVQNALPLAIQVFERDPSTGEARYRETLAEGQAKTITTLAPTLRILLAADGAIVCDVPLPITTQKLVIESTKLTGPNRVPPPVGPSASLLIPPDSVPWVVGVGLYGSDPAKPIVFLREQFWRKGPESFSLPPQSSLQKILRQTSGRTATSSTTAEVTKELSLQATAGWGPFSATVSASLSTTSQRTDTLTVREESTASIEQAFSNDTDNSVLVCLWQLVERIRVVKSGKLAAAIDNGLLPLIPLSYTLPGTDA